MAQDLKKLQWRLQFPRTQVQKELFSAIKSLCAVNRDLWKDLEKESRISDLFQIVQNDYPLTLQEETRLLSAADIFGARRKDDLKKAGMEVIQVSNGLSSIDEIKQEAAKQEVQVYAHLKPAKTFGFAHIAGEHETLKLIIYCVRKLPAQVQPHRWGVLVSMSEASVAEDMETRAVILSDPINGVIRTLSSDTEAKCAIEKESMIQVAHNAARTPGEKRVELWRSLSAMAQFGLDASDITAAYYRKCVAPSY